LEVEGGTYIQLRAPVTSAQKLATPM